jgi:hypothetical protein
MMFLVIQEYKNYYEQKNIDINFNNYRVDVCDCNIINED